MTIIRDGKAIELTQAELNQAWNEAEKQRIRSEVEYCIEDYSYSFDNYDEATYSSADDCKEDFIEYALETISDKVDLYESFCNRIADIVADCAEAFDLEPEY